ncbi:MAG: hypothetical protein ABIN89_10110 [Chitinophagaceae bacterium]
MTKKLSLDFYIDIHERLQYIKISNKNSTMNILIENYKGHLIYLHTATCTFTCEAIGELNSFYKMCREIDALVKII